MTPTPLSDSPHALARLYGPLVFKAAWRVLGDRALAEDVQQDVFLHLIEAPPREIESWPAFLTSAAVRRAIDILRRQKRWFRLSALWSTDEPQAESAEQVSVDQERAQRLRTELAKLPQREAQCFGLRYLQGLEIHDIALALDLSDNNVNVTLHRARKRLEARLGDTPGASK